MSIRHGTSGGYAGHKCRCDYCAAWNRVRRRPGDQSRLLAQLAEAAANGTALPISADPQRRGPSNTPKAVIETERMSAEEAAAKAKEARLRAVQKANRSIAALAMLTVAEYTPDFALAARYGRIGLALAEEAGHEPGTQKP